MSYDEAKGNRERPFRFGVGVPTAGSRAEWAEKARKSEDLGFSTLHVADHLAEVLPPMPAMLAAAEATTTLRVGSLVLNNDFRHPVLVAREAAAVDLLSDGRLELGLGAGHAEPEYRQAGLTFDRPPTRVARLAESVVIIKALLAGEEVTLAGEHYDVRDHRVHPLPVQKPHPPILVGGNNRTLLRFAAREADIVGLSGTGRTNADGVTHEATGFPPSAVDERIALVREAAGDRSAHLELHALVQAVIVTDDPRAASERMRERLPELTVEEILTTPYLLIGTIGEMVDDLRARRERFGFSYFSVFEPAAEALAPVIARLAGF
ncbi:LLM class F420-dependent oxidoreductase [soil metagenome]